MFDRMRMSKRGISTVLGSVIFVSIMLIMVTLLGWMLTQASSYNEAAQQRNQLDWERQNEHLRAISLIMDEDSNSFFIMIENTGAVTATIDTIWLIVPSLHTFYSVEITMNPGNVTTYVFTQTDVTLDPYGEYTLRLVTTRGNIVNIRYPFVFGEEGVISPAGYIDVGPVRLDYESFTWTSEDCPEKQAGWTITTKNSSDNTLWYVTIINICDKDIIVSGYSLIQMVPTETGSPVSYFVVNPSTSSSDTWPTPYVDGTQTFYSNPENPYLGGPPVELVLGASKAFGSKWQTTGLGVQEYSVFIVLFGTYSDGSPYAQTIPFEAVLVT